MHVFVRFHATMMPEQPAEPADLLEALFMSSPLRPGSADAALKPKVRPASASNARHVEPEASPIVHYRSSGTQQPSRPLQHGLNTLHPQRPMTAGLPIRAKAHLIDRPTTPAKPRYVPVPKSHATLQLKT